MMKIPLADLPAQYLSIKAEIDNAIAATVSSGQFILDPEVRASENEMAAYIGVKHAVGLASGTDALHLALLACGIGPGDEVITTPFTFIATVDMLMHTGARPVFVDIDPDTYNIDTSLIAPAITGKTKAILPVHLYGQPVNMAAVLSLAEKYNLKVIEDCAQALGSEYKDKKAGSMGDAGCLSFFPSKSLGAFGDGGMVVTDNPEIAEKVDLLRRHGAKPAYYYSMLGFNSRLDALQAAVLRVKLRHLDEWTRLRREKAALYSNRLRQISGISISHVLEDCWHSFNYYTIRLADGISRDDLRKHLDTEGVATAIYYPLSLHLQEACQSLGYRAGDFPNSEKAQEQVISLPMYPELGESQIETICRAIKKFITNV